MAKDKVVRVSVAPLERARELLPSLDRAHFGPGESPTMSDRQLVDTAMGWLIGRLQSDVFTKREVDDVVLKSVVNVLGDVLGVKVNGMALDGALTVSWEAPDKQHNEVVINMEA